MTSLDNILLDGIEFNAWEVSHYAKEIERRANKLTTAPDFRTRAEAELEKAQAQVTAALEAIRAKRVKVETLQAAE